MTDPLLVEAQRVERAIGRVRWAAAALALLLGPLFPNLSIAAVYSLGAGIVLYNIATLLASRRAWPLARHRQVARAAFAADLLALSTAMLLFSADPLWTTYILGPLVITAGTFRFGTAGAVAATVVLAAAYVGIVVFRSSAFDFTLGPERVVFTVSVYVMTAVLVDRVLRDADQIRIERERLIRDLERRSAEDTALAGATRVVASVAMPEEVVPRVLAASRPVLRFDRATVFVADPDLGEYRVLHRLADDEDDVLPPRAQLGSGLIAATLADERAIVVPNVLADPRHRPGPGEVARSVLLVPLRVGGRSIAVFTASRALPDTFGPNDLRLAQAVAALIAQTLENQRLLAEAGQARALRELDRLKDEFLAAVSHELRTPLTVVSGAFELLARQGAALPEVSHQLVAQGQRHAERLARSVAELLDIAQLQEAKVELDLEFVPAAELLADVVASHEALAAGRSQRIVVGPCTAPPAYVDRRRMLQVLGNLVANAVRYSPQGGTIWCDAELRDGNVVFSVIDQGPGIPPEERERVFDKFVRLRRDRDVPGATGLGLAIAKDLVRLHGGSIWVDDAPAGTTFHVALPHQAAPVEREAIG